MIQKQTDIDPVERDYGYIAYFQKSMDNYREHAAPDQTGRDLSAKEKNLQRMIRKIMIHEGLRDYFSASLRQINHLIQIDQKPNLELTEPKWELYKISISFGAISK